MTLSDAKLIQIGPNDLTWLAFDVNHLSCLENIYLIEKCWELIK